jgi:hypothetical protein
VLGEDHPDTLRSASSLADDLSNLGEHQAAPRTGRGHPGPPRARRGPSRSRQACNLAADLQALGEAGDGP